MEMNTQNVKSRFSIEVTKQRLEQIIGIVIFLCIIIFFAGIIASRVQHKIDNTNPLTFPEESYSPASKVKTGSYSKIERSFFLKILELDLKGNTPGVQSFLNRLSDNMGGKDVIVSQIDLASSPETMELFNQQEKLLRSKIKTLEEEISGSKYYAKSTLEEKQACERKLVYISSFKENLQRLSFYPSLKFPKVDGDKTFAFVMGRFSNIYSRGDDGFMILISEASPIVSKKYLGSLNWNEEELAKVDFDKESKRLKDIRNSAKTQFDTEVRDDKKKQKEEIKKARKEYRKVFYPRWYSILLNLITISVVLFILFQYILIIRRKGVPKKTTHEVYFATNLTSLFLRWIALGISVIGFLMICLSLFFFMSNTLEMSFESNLSGNYPFFSNTGFLYAVVLPILYLVIVVVTSWIIILQSEFICFLSNVYHVLFEKAYRNGHKDE